MASITPRASGISPERFAAVREVLEKMPGVTVEADPQAPNTMRIHIDRLDVTKDGAEQIASMAQSRLGDKAIVYVYDASTRRLARADAYGVK
jgi:hypothetical protein